jgi:Flp pilus assembly protein TadB
VTALAAAAACLAAAALVGGYRVGAARMRVLDPAPPPPGLTEPVRPAWIAVGSVAAGCLGWLLGGGLAPGIGSALVGLGAALGVRHLLGRPAAADTAELAACWELVAVCLAAGLPVAPAVTAAADPVRGEAGERLRRVAGLLALGADPGQAWASAEGVPELAGFARAAARSAGTGSALAQVARAESARLRAELADGAQARAQRAAVQITAPLGVCFLPAFIVLGVAPVVIGLATEALARW